MICSFEKLLILAVGQEYEVVRRDKSSLWEKIYRTSKKLRWDQGKARDLRSRLTSTTMILETYTSELVRCQQERQTIISWLCPHDAAAQQNELLSRHQENTGQWLTKSKEFLTWLNETKVSLFCSGYPGVGKTMLSAVVIEYLGSKLRGQDQSIGLVYIYCDYKKRDE